MREFLKVKVKSLAAESRIIRLEERKAKKCKKGGLRESLYHHRINIVRPTARSSNLAYGFMCGVAYLDMERTCRSAPDWKAVERMITKYGGGLHNKALSLLEEAKQNVNLIDG